MWGGISKRGATELIIFDGIMDGDFYRDKIVKEGLIPFIRSKFPDHHRLMQDNDPKHTAKATAKYFEDNNVNWWKTPAESPDLNPIENVWHEMKNHICRVVKPKTKQELEEGLKEFWKTVKAEKCTRYINHIQKVMPKVIAAEGGPCGE